MAQYEISNFVDPKVLTDVKSLGEGIQGTTQDLLKFLEAQKALKKQLDDTAASTASNAEKSEKYAKTVNDAAKGQQQLSATQKQLISQQNQLNATEAKLATANSKTNQTLAQKRKELAEQNKITKLNSVINDQNTGSLERAAAQNQLLEIEKKKLNLTTKEGQARLAQINKIQDENNKLTQESGNKLQQQKINIGNYKSALTGLTTSFKNGEIGVGGMIKGVIKLGLQMIKSIVMNPVLLTIGLIVGAVVALYKAFVSTDAGATELAARLEQLKAIMDVVRQRVAGLANGVKALFSGDRQKAAEEFKNAVSGIGEQMKEAAKAAYDYAYELDRIKDSETNFISRSAEIRNRIAQLEYTAQDRTKSTAERQKALEEAIALGEEEVRFRKKNAEDIFNNEVTNLAAKYAISADQIRNFITMTDEEQKNASAEQLEFRNKLNDEGYQNLEEMYAKMLEADTKFFEENKRNISRLTGFQEEARKAELERIQKLNTAREEAAKLQEKLVVDNRKIAADNAKFETEMDQFIMDEKFEDFEDEKEMQAMLGEMIKKNIIDNNIAYTRQRMLIDATSKTEQERAERIFNLDKEVLNSAITANEQLLNSSTLSAVRRVEIEGQIAQQRVDLEQMVFDKEMENNEKRKEAQEQLNESIIATTNAIFDFRAERISQDLELLEQANARGELSDTEYAKKKAELEIKAAKNKKVSGIFNATISTAESITSAMTVAPPLGFILAGLAAVMGALQIATIASEPLPAMPAFAKGTDNAPRRGLFGEAGAELMLTQSGAVYYADKPTYFDGNEFKGAKIWSGAETAEIMNLTKTPQFGSSSRTDNLLLMEIKGMRKDMKRQKSPIFGEGNKPIGFEQNGSTTKIINFYKYGR